jgi:ABC-type multidrug transport system, ATPase component
MAENQIEIQNLNKFYRKKQALNGVSLMIGQGMFGLLGCNGAGKTTLMKILATLLHKNSGAVTVCGVPVKRAKEIRRMVGYLPQDFSMYPGMTVYEAMDYLGVLSELDGPTRKTRIPELLQRVNLQDNSKTKVKALFGGMRRRLGIAQAILHDPKVLIVDEPTAGLDPEKRVRFRNLLCELAEDQIVLLSTHIVGDIEAACEKIAILDEGKLLFTGLASELIETAENKVFTVSVPQKDLQALKENYLVTGMHMQKGEVSVRLISDDTPPQNAVSCFPTIEDAYFLCMHKSGTPKQLLGGELS